MHFFVAHVCFCVQYLSSLCLFRFLLQYSGSTKYRDNFLIHNLCAAVHQILRLWARGDTSRTRTVVKILPLFSGHPSLKFWSRKRRVRVFWCVLQRKSLLSLGQRDRLDHSTFCNFNSWLLEAMAYTVDLFLDRNLQAAFCIWVEEPRNIRISKRILQGTLEVKLRGKI